MRSRVNVLLWNKFSLVVGRSGMKSERRIEIGAKIAVSMRCDERHQVRLLRKLDHIEDRRGE